jgi:hypothetical protein
LINLYANREALTSKVEGNPVPSLNLGRCNDYPKRSKAEDELPLEVRKSLNIFYHFGQNGVN